MKQAERLIEALYQQGIEQAFVVTGGAAMFINEALRISKIKSLATHHEQSASMAAEAYFRVTGKVALLSTTAGPGALNALNGVFGAYTDSIPMIIISGQARTSTLRISQQQKALRQLGDQEVDVPAIVRPITKKVFQIGVDSDLESVIAQALKVATSGRPGPVWIDFPIDYQSKEIVDFDTIESEEPEGIIPSQDLIPIFRKICEAKRPVFLVGTGLSSHLGREALSRLSSSTTFPIQPAWTAIDLVPSTDSNFAGRPGTVGDRVGGIIQEASDLIIVLGSSLSLRQIGFNTDAVLGNKVIQVDIDPAYSFRNDILGLELITHSPLDFIQKFLSYFEKNFQKNQSIDWLRRCHEVLEEIPPEPTWSETCVDGINPYAFFTRLPQLVPADSIFACGDASASVMLFQAGKFLPNQRVFTNAGSASMGYELPAAIGAAVGTSRPIICVAGDGSFQQNIQELALLKYHKLNIHIVYIDNGGYLSIRTSQKKHFSSSFLESQSSGLPFPNIEEVAIAYGLNYQRFDNLEEIENLSNSEVPLLSHIIVSPAIQFAPKTGSKVSEQGVITSSTIADLEPFLPKHQLAHLIDYLKNGEGRVHSPFV
jgi:acetolactate synthase I/II/III large subunit